MQTIPYSEVIDAVQSLAGVDSFESGENRRLKPLVNRRARQCYRRTDYWPRFLVVGEFRSVNSDSRLGSGVTVDTFLRIHAQKPFHNCGTSEYRFYVDTTGANIAAYCPNSVDVGVISSVQTISGIVILTVQNPESFWRSFLTINGGDFTFSGISGTPIDASINGTHACSIDNPGGDPFATTLTFIADPSVGQPAYYADGTVSPDANGILYLFGDSNGKQGFSNTGLGVFDLWPDGQTNIAYWDAAQWVFYIYSVTSGISTLLGGWTSAEDVASPDLVTSWTPLGAEVGSPTFAAQTIIPDSVTPVNGTVASQGAYVTYKRALPSSYGNDAGEDPNIPKEWADIIIQLVFADWLRAEGQTEKAVAEEQIAEEYMLDQLQEIEAQGYSQSVGKRIFTNLNTTAGFL